MKGELKNQRGASMVEFAIVLPLLLLLVFGIIEFGLLLYNKAMITNASREGARSGIVSRWNNTTNPATYIPLDAGGIEGVVNAYLSNHLITFTPGGATPSFNPPPTPCDRNNPHSLPRPELRVTVNYPYTFLVFSNIVNLFPKGGGTPFPGAITLTAETVMRCE